MSRTVFCQRQHANVEGLDFAPLPGDLGQRIFENIGKPAWSEWLAQQTMLINENRLNPRDPKARAYLAEQAERFLFGDGGEQPAGYVAPDES